ncbi:MAG: 3-hydroxyacyl-CoA dehydrogenase family protein [Thermoplasmata archaeon]|nr:3-hydroxyacyl-CoA dehydrogenase family protein [Candidatus Sysuiplasma acidicola]MBX8646417.1 3-hydroxyacyl-CoA dehydrogenase family protein [Candidatus Sysuiplasma acidicola]MDH2906349.1 3-hydroxyacyl-CoA dehydrogenase NAD-binding domain-containing protein [Methanomassiliicoccales archaeon]
MFVKKVGIIGAGTMGSAIAELMAFNGMEVVLKDVSEELVSKGMKNIERIVSGLAAYHGKRAQEQIRKIEELGVSLSAEQKAKIELALKPKYTEKDVGEVMARVRGTTAYSDLDSADLIIEAAFENLEVKKKIFREVDAAAPQHAILASNTSSISITAIASATGRRGRVIGMHFFNPPYTLPLIEIIPGLETWENTTDDIMSFLQGLRNHRYPMVPIKVRESPGFLVNRLLVPMLNEACFCLQEGIASARDIDTAMKAGAGLPMGPLELADMVGVDISYDVSKVLYEEFGDSKYRPSPLLKQMVAAGRLGRKTGKGFFEYVK